ncbi:MAG TPA: phosphopantetheine-binding protein [Nitrospirota bacterium]|jgi:acyl carrier protein
MGDGEVSEVKSRLKGMIVERLKLQVDPGGIDDDAPLFGEGLGLDSIDALELVVGLEQEFGVQVPDEAVGREAFASINTLVEFVIRNRA